MIRSPPSLPPCLFSFQPLPFVSFFGLTFKHFLPFSLNPNRGLSFYSRVEVIIVQFRSFFETGPVRCKISVSACMSVCLSVCEHISKTRCPNFTKFGNRSIVHVACGSGVDLFWWRCNMICTSGFMTGVIFGFAEP